MALKTLQFTEEIGGFKVIIMDDLKKTHPEMFGESGAMDYKRFEEEIRPKYPIQIRHDKNSISFTIQDGPIKDNGVNGCQVDTMIEAARDIIVGLNIKTPCAHNRFAVQALDEALYALAQRKKDRVKRGVEGTNKT